MRQRANERAREILATHRPKPLSPEPEAEVHRIAKAAQEWALTHPMLDYQPN